MQMKDGFEPGLELLIMASAAVERSALRRDYFVWFSSRSRIIFQLILKMISQAIPLERVAAHRPSLFSLSFLLSPESPTPACLVPCSADRMDGRSRTTTRILSSHFPSSEALALHPTAVASPPLIAKDCTDFPPGSLVRAMHPAV